MGLRTPVWVIVLLAFFYGAFTSLQYTSMNTLVYADITEEETSSASSIASTMQQMSISFGVASAGLATALFIPSRADSNPPQMIRGLRGLLHPCFRRIGHPHRRRISLQWQLRKFHWRDLHPLEHQLASLQPTMRLVARVDYEFRVSGKVRSENPGNGAAPLSPWLYSLGSSVVRSGPCRHRRRVQCR